jgi:hypothetical protein
MKKSVSFLVCLIAFFSFIATTFGIFTNQGGSQSKFKSVFGETISIYGKGLYKNDSVAMAQQAIAQDYVTLFVGIPLLLLSLYFSKKGLMKGRLLLTGTLGYFLYTYASYSFLSMYNSMFLLYVLLMSASFFSFTMMMMTFDMKKLQYSFNQRLPVKFIGGFLLLVSFCFGMMWLGKIVPSLISDAPPAGLEHYTTLVIQALDLGFVIPVGILAGLLIIRRTPFGYLLASIIIIKDITLITALTMMAILQKIAGINVSMVLIAIVALINLLVIFCLVLVMKNVNEIFQEGGTAL